MRQKVSADAIDRFMKAIGRAGKTNTHIYFVGGVSAVLRTACTNIQRLMLSHFALRSKPS